MNKNIIKELRSRQALEQCSEKGDIAEHLSSPRTLYCGFDPTANSLHVGSLLPLFTLFRFTQYKHNAIILLGGGTGLIGDPSFKSGERDLQDPAELSKRCEAIKKQCETIHHNFIKQYDQPQGDLCFENNIDWLGELKLIEFLRDIGKMFSVNSMIAKESVSQRIDRDNTGISFTEFNYMLLQSYDFMQLYQQKNCTVQLGGSDQWGNITTGLELIRRIQAQNNTTVPPSINEQVFGITIPLITSSDGRKFGKTESGAVWLSAERTSPYAFSQFWLNIADTDVYRYVRYFSFVPLADQFDKDDITALLDAKKKLAREMTALVHGTEAADAVDRIRIALFEDKATQLAEHDLGQLALDGLDNTLIKDTSRLLTECLVDSGLALTPRGEVTLGQAKKLINSGAIKVNGETITQETAELKQSSALYGKYHLLKRGKKHYHLMRWS